MANSQPWHARIEPEIFWVKYQPFLFSRGYELRPRYQPKWAPRPGSLGRGEDSLGLMVAIEYFLYMPIFNDLMDSECKPARRRQDW